MLRAFKKVYTISFLTIFFISLTAQSKKERYNKKIVKKWELQGFAAPESILYDKTNNILYVSNVNGHPTDKDNNGFISKVSPEGKIIDKKWITGLNAPKGMAIYNHKLYVSDIDQIVEIDLEKGKIYHKYEVKGATFLNDVTVDKRGNVYVSNNFGFSAIYKLADGKVDSWIRDEKLYLPNGLAAKNGMLYVAGWGNINGYDTKTYTTKESGRLLKISIADKTISELKTDVGNLDGLEKTKRGFFITDFMVGALKYFNIKKNKIITLIDLPKGSADIGLNKKKKVIYIPLMLNNKIVAYSFKKQ